MFLQNHSGENAKHQFSQLFCFAAEIKIFLRIALSFSSETISIISIHQVRKDEMDMAAETILVVDDNREIVYSLGKLLKYEGYDIVEAYDGMEALEALDTHHIDLILLDVMMPRLNGLSARINIRICRCK